MKHLENLKRIIKLMEEIKRETVELETVGPEKRVMDCRHCDTVADLSAITAALRSCGLDKEVDELDVKKELAMKIPMTCPDYNGKFDGIKLTWEED